MIHTSQQIGGALGIAALSTIATSKTQDSVSSGSALPVALVDGFQSAFLVGAIVAALGVVAALTLIRRDELVVELPTSSCRRRCWTPPRRRRTDEEGRVLVDRPLFAARGSGVHPADHGVQRPGPAAAGAR